MPLPAESLWPSTPRARQPRTCSASSRALRRHTTSTMGVSPTSAPIIPATLSQFAGRGSLSGQDDDEVNVLGLLAFERTEALVVEFDRAQIDVLLQLEPGAEQDAFFENARFHVGMADEIGRAH